MSKKYVPSGYQIISIDVSNVLSGDTFVPTTEDEKILYDMLTSGRIEKPILLDVTTAYGRYSGFGVIRDDSITLISGNPGSSYTVLFVISGTEIEFQYAEE